MNKKYEIPTNKNIFCYSSKTEILEPPTTLPDELRLWTSLSLEDYSNIVHRLNIHFKNKQKSSFVWFLLLICIVVSVVLYVKQPLETKYITIILVGSLLIVVIFHFYVITLLNKNLNRILIVLNEQYSCKGLKIESENFTVGFGRNRRNITRINIAYNEDWNRQPNPQLFENPIIQPNHQEIELSTIQQIPSQPYYTPPIPPPNNVYNSISLEKDDQQSISNNYSQPQSINNNYSQPQSINNNYSQPQSYSNVDNIPIDLESPHKINK
ncbi:hypothetical protein DICPUDRAFT_74365 [Dictyostelium purpureum]|uniref:Uncharacterized protein n=1 Tax=Dictyostelium purpureum TaxID=5786 RepID=F0Z7I7_DICPU|nr:uncharacterized protein DICPUDRAFT_74365 [Dictyostelium purpureum]EGC40067.1 hypothetical protein DICPUDRAFT_74365 [Dictyostelium purpureum]|eukprot:XP_003283416.1 hypothetical protein DICPUDRAFT_74365 [Dictyostelium purpureum]